MRENFMGNKTKKISLFVNSILNSLWLFGFCMVIMLFSLMFYAAEMMMMLRMAIGVAMALPLCVLFYSRGHIIASREFANRNIAISPDKTVEVNKVPFGVGLVMILPYALILIFLVLLGNITGIYPFQSIALFVCMPATICFKALGLIVTFEGANWLAVLAVGVFLFIMCGMYFFGFYKTLKDKERNFRDMLNEVKFNSKF
jgi:hypothetical protein